MCAGRLTTDVCWFDNDVFAVAIAIAIAVAVAVAVAVADVNVDVMQIIQ